MTSTHPRIIPERDSYGRTTLHTAMQESIYGITTSSAIQHGIDTIFRTKWSVHPLVMRDGMGRTPLHIAVRMSIAHIKCILSYATGHRDHRDVVNALLTALTLQDNNGFTPLHACIAEEYTSERLRLLVDWYTMIGSNAIGDKGGLLINVMSINTIYDRTLLSMAADLGNVELMDVLVEWYAMYDFGLRELFINSRYANSRTIIGYTMSTKRYHCVQSFVKILFSMIYNIENVNDAFLLELIKESMVDIDTINVILNCTNDKGMTLLHITAAGGNKTHALLEYLVNLTDTMYRVDNQHLLVACCRTGLTPMHHAVISGNVESVQSMLKVSRILAVSGKYKGRSLKQRMDSYTRIMCVENMTPLHYAVEALASHSLDDTHRLDLVEIVTALIETDNYPLGMAYGGDGEKLIDTLSKYVTATDEALIDVLVRSGYMEDDE